MDVLENFSGISQMLMETKVCNILIAIMTEVCVSVPLIKRSVCFYLLQSAKHIGGKGPRLFMIIQWTNVTRIHFVHRRNHLIDSFGDTSCFPSWWRTIKRWCWLVRKCSLQYASLFLNERALELMKVQDLMQQLVRLPEGLDDTQIPGIPSWTVSSSVCQTFDLYKPPQGRNEREPSLWYLIHLWKNKVISNHLFKIPKSKCPQFHSQLTVSKFLKLYCR